MNRRDLAALVTVVVIAVPGLAVAQQSASEDPPAGVEATEQVTEVPTETSTGDATEVATDDATETDTDALQSTEAEPEADRFAVQQEDEEDQESVDEGHGELVSTLARCLPSGRDLHGTGWTKGAIISQVASTGTFTAEDGTTTDVTEPADAEALCEQVQGMADAAETPETAKGRPSWAGPDGDAKPEQAEKGEKAEKADKAEDDEDDGSDGPAVDDRGGPPDHAPAHGRRGR